MALPIASNGNDPRFTSAKAAEYLGVKPQTLALWRSAGRYSLPFIRVGRLIQYRKSDLDAWLASRTVGAIPAAM